MKILIVLKNFNQRKGLPGGVGNANEEIGKVMEKLGHKVDFLAREDDLKINSLLKSIFPLRKKIKELVKKEKYDIIYTQDWSLTFPLLFPYRMLRKKHFACFCGREEVGLIIIQDIVGYLMRKKLIVIGDRLKKDFPRATLIYRGVNFEKFRPLSKKRDSLGWVEKGAEYKCINKEELEEVAKACNLKLLIAKKIPSDKMNEFYNKCKVFISLPPQAGYNNVWNEAMAAGVPIVIGNDKGAGTMLPFNRVLDSENNIERITQIINNPKKIDYRKWLIENGFSWNETAKKLLRAFSLGNN